MKKLEHIGIAVEDLETAERIFGDVLGSPSYKREEVLGEAVLTSFFKAGESKVELLVPTSPDSAIARHLEGGVDSRGEHDDEPERREAEGEIGARAVRVRHRE